MGTTVELRLPGPLTDDVVARTCDALRTGLGAGDVSRVVCHLDRVPSDLAAVDALARLALTARRAGAAFDLRGHDADLPQLLELVGLSGLLLGAEA
jgi:ABC-type transporter Mla MlaB component